MQQLDATQVAARLDRRTLIDALDAAFRKPHRIPDRHHHRIEPTQTGGSGGSLLLMPAWDPGGALGIKVVTVFTDNAQRGLPAVHASYLLLDATTGQARALLDGGELTLRRTAAASALASRYLAAADAERLLLVGTGRLAPHLIESHLLVRPIREVRIWGRRAAPANALAQSLQRPGLSISVTDDLQAATRWADIVSCATLSHQPLVLGAWLKAGQHLDLVGAFTPQMREVDDEAIARCALYVDTRAGALAESGEIIGALERGVIAQGAILAEFSELRAGTFKRPSDGAITVFKSVGTALEDLVAAQLVLDTHAVGATVLSASPR
jgi:ornithine cyclodeaminase